MIDPHRESSVNKPAFGCLRALGALVCAFLLHEAVLNLVYSKTADGICWSLGGLTGLAVLRPRVGWLTAAMLGLAMFHSTFYPLDLGHLDDLNALPQYHSRERAQQMAAAIWFPALACSGVWLIRIAFGEGAKQKENVNRVVSRFTPRARAAVTADSYLRPTEAPLQEDLLRPARTLEAPTDDLLRSASGDDVNV